MRIKIGKIVQDQGTSNTGNVTRRFFKNTEMAKITEVNLNLIKKLGYILITIFIWNINIILINFESFDQYYKERNNRIVHWVV